MHQPLSIWLIKDGEPIPLKTTDKHLRAGMLSEALAKRGHQVTWWASTHNHQHKQRTYTKDTTLQTEGGVIVKLLECGGYKKNISIARIRHHRKLAKRFITEAEKMPKPDVIICSFPTIETAYATVKFGRKHHIPTIIDVRDMWPDIFWQYLPNWMQPAIRLATLHMRHMAKYAFKHCDALTSMSQDLCKWAVTISKRPPHKSRQIFYLGSDLDRVPPPNTSQYIEQLRKNTATPLTICIFLGSMGHSYDLMTIAKAAEKLENASLPSPFYFLLVGEGAQYQALQEQTKKLKNVKILGWQDRQAAAELLIGADIGLLSVHNHAVPNKLFDYITGGLVIANSAPGEGQTLISKYKLGENYTAGDVDSLIYALNTIHQKGTDTYKKPISAFAKQTNSSTIYNKFANLVEKTAYNYD